MSEPHKLAWVDYTSWSDTEPFKVMPRPSDHSYVVWRQRGSWSALHRPNGWWDHAHPTREAAKEACEAHNQSQKAQQQ